VGYVSVRSFNMPPPPVSGSHGDCRFWGYFHKINDICKLLTTPANDNARVRRLMDAISISPALPGGGGELPPRIKAMSLHPVDEEEALFCKVTCSTQLSLSVSPKIDEESRP